MTEYQGIGKWRIIYIYTYTHIYNQSLKSGIFPELWKKSFITLVHKSGSKHDIANYIPISIISCFANLLDAIISEKMYDVLCPISKLYYHRIRGALLQRISSYLQNRIICIHIKAVRSSPFLLHMVYHKTHILDIY